MNTTQRLPSNDSHLARLPVGAVDLCWKNTISKQMTVASRKTATMNSEITNQKDGPVSQNILCSEDKSKMPFTRKYRKRQSYPHRQ